MPFGIPVPPLSVSIMVLVGVAAVVFGLAAVAALVTRGDDDEEVFEASHPDEVTLSPPNLKTATFGWPQKVWRLHRHIRKRRKLADKGYVQWFLVDGTYPTPKFIKPEDEGGGIHEYEHDGVTYLFPKEAMLPSSEQGLWTVVHKRGEADPINLREPDKNAIPADVLDEYLTMQTTASSPSLLDKLNVDARQVIMYSIAAVILIAAIRGGI